MKTVLLAEALIAGLPLSSPLPAVNPSADGEIGFVWPQGSRIVEAILDCDGILVWVWSVRGEVHPGGEVQCDGSFPDELLTLLKTVEEASAV